MTCFILLNVQIYVILQLLEHFNVCDKHKNFLINRLEHYSCLAIDWFKINFIKLIQDKCNLLFSRIKNKNVWVETEKARILKVRNTNY